MRLGALTTLKTASFLIIEHLQMGRDKLDLFPVAVKSAVKRAKAPDFSRASRSSNAIWRRRADSNRRIEVLQTSSPDRGTCAFDGDGRFDAGGYTNEYKSSRWTTFSIPVAQFESFLERETGIEPATLCLGSKCSTTKLIPFAFRTKYPSIITFALWVSVVVVFSQKPFARLSASLWPVIAFDHEFPAQ